MSYWFATKTASNYHRLHHGRALCGFIPTDEWVAAPERKQGQRRIIWEHLQCKKCLQKIRADLEQQTRQKGYDPR